MTTNGKHIFNVLHGNIIMMSSIHFSSNQTEMGIEFYAQNNTM